MSIDVSRSVKNSGKLLLFKIMGSRFLMLMPGTPPDDTRHEWQDVGNFFEELWDRWWKECSGAGDMVVDLNR
jgi:hypothetical protein